MRGLRSTDRESQKSPGAVKSSTGDGAAKELAHVTHGREQGWGDGLRGWGDGLGEWGCWAEEAGGEKSGQL